MTVDVGGTTLGSRVAAWMLAACLPAGALLAAALPAEAHVQPPGVRTVFDRLDPQLPEVDVVVRTSVAPQLILENRGGTLVEVLAPTGEPFLRIGPAGVEANLGSAAWYESNNPTGRATVPALTDLADRWITVSRDPSWGWFDHRMHPGDLRIPPGTRPGSRLASWQVPLRQGAVAARILGGVDFSAPASGSPVATVTTPSPAPGVRVSVLQGVVPGLLLESSSAAPVVVAGMEGEPFLRIGPEGVAVNRRSPTFQEVARLTGQAFTGEADASAEPDWQEIAAGNRHAWLEPRAVLPQPVEGAVATWKIPLTVDGHAARIEGETRFVAAGAPTAPREEAGFPWLLAGAGGVAAAVLGFAAVRLVSRSRTGPAGRGGGPGRPSR
ncbi:MAG: hypothetical protein ACRDJO_02530 [Actinomycetota bacterium]